MPLTYRSRGSHPLRAVAALSAAAVVCVGAAGCGSSKKSSSTGSTSSASGGGNAAVTLYGASVSADPTISGQVPAAVKSKGTLTVATDATYAPNEFVGSNGKTIEGMDPDLGKALAAVMGLKVKVVNAGFDSILPGLASGKYDLGMSSFTDTKQREQTVDFVTYFSSGTAFYVKTGGASVNGLADICGKKVAVEKGTTQAADVTAQNKKCTAAGKKAADLQVYPDQNGANLAIQSGRAEIGMADSPVAEYQVKQSGGQFKTVGQVYGTAPYGIAIPKNGMAKAVLAALQKLISDGTYKTILSHWGIQSGGITDPKINGAES